MKEIEIEELKSEVNKNSLSNVMSVETVGNQYVYNIMSTFQIIDIDQIESSYFQYYTANPNDTWNLMSYNIYGTVDFYWLLLKLNDARDPTFDPIPGTRYRYVSESDVVEIVNSIRGS